MQTSQMRPTQRHGGDYKSVLTDKDKTAIINNAEYMTLKELAEHIGQTKSMVQHFLAVNGLKCKKYLSKS